MQPNEIYSTPRRPLDVEDYIDIVRRHKGWIFGPFLFCLVASVVGVYLYPDSFVSQEVVKITPQQIPQSMVQSSINQEMFDRITSMEQEILSRAVLTNIIRNDGLYSRELSRMPMEDVIEVMKKNITITPVTGLNSSGAARAVPAFAIQFSYSDRMLAQKVTQDLGGRFIDENIRNSSNRTFETTRFMKDEEDQAKKELDAIEDKLTAFRVKNNGKLPDQVQGNMQQMTALQSQVYAINASLSRAQQDKLQIEATLRILKDQQIELSKQQPSEAMTAAVVQRNEQLADADKDVQYWDDTLRALRQKYSDNYPDVQTAIGRLNSARQKRDEIQKQDLTKKAQAKTSSSAKPALSPLMQREERDLDAHIRELQGTSAAKDLEIQDASKELKRATDAIRSYESRLETVPLGEQEYGDLLRDRDIAKQKYVDLDERLEKAERAEGWNSGRKARCWKCSIRPRCP